MLHVLYCNVCRGCSTACYHLGNAVERRRGWAREAYMGGGWGHEMCVTGERVEGRARAVAWCSPQRYLKCLRLSCRSHVYDNCPLP
jgi:hypothetical protein